MFCFFFSEVPKYPGSILRLKVIVKMNRTFSRLNTLVKSLELKLTRRTIHLFY